ncbi:hypothetical protein UFOVP1264_79 [uncultured Caudovirales phage]|uniref:Major tropism determinant N-terminal domain-containing protein n=1 Tax=uncultured Caudovirales phage TaxID=2100421 RepID=A0A6J5RRZ4_9CAUD|nr:hypothetical protein UFOVP1264_79 [uncultured Caudovirales phage]
MAIKIQYRRGTDAEWTAANPLLAAGEPGFVTDTGQFKIGNGVTYWSDLVYGITTGVGAPAGGTSGYALVKNSNTAYDFTWAPVMRAGGSNTLSLSLRAGTATAGTAPLYFTSGTSLTSPAAGAMEFDGTNLYFSPSTTRRTFAFLDSPTFTGTVSAPALSLTGVSDTATAASHYFVETASDGFIRPKTLANVKTEVVTTAAVNSAAATTVGTVTSGSWTASTIAGQYGGTGVANTGRTITLGGNITTAAALTQAGAFATTLTSTATTNATLPAGTVTLVDTTSAQVISGKTSYNGLALTAASTGFTVAGGTTSKTLTVNNTLALSGTDSTTLTMPAYTTSVPGADFWYAPSANVTLSTVATAQSIFGLTNGVALAATSVYAFEAYIAVSSAESVTSHTLNLGFAYSGTLTNIDYGYLHQYNTTSFAALTPTGGFMGFAAVATTTPIQPAVAVAATYYHLIRVSGVIRTTTAGNLNPQLTWTVAPTAAPVVQRGSWIKLKTLGSASATATSFGTWS